MARFMMTDNGDAGSDLAFLPTNSRFSGAKA
jgi:hypothetical protein